jgi:hypothetical protein
VRGDGRRSCRSYRSSGVAGGGIRNTEFTEWGESARSLGGIAGAIIRARVSRSVAGLFKVSTPLKMKRNRMVGKGSVRTGLPGQAATRGKDEIEEGVLRDPNLPMGADSLGVESKPDRFGARISGLLGLEKSSAEWLHS